MRGERTTSRREDDTRQSPASARATELAVPARPLLIQYAHPLALGPLATWDAALDRCAALGFNTFLTAPLFAPGHDGDVFLSSDLRRPNPALGLSAQTTTLEAIAELADRCRARGLALMLDLAMDRVAPGGALAKQFGLAGESRDDPPDPRRDPRAQHAAEVPPAWLSTLSHPYLGLWSEVLRDLAEAGVAGFRCLRPGSLSVAAWRALLDAARARRPDMRFLAWTPGLNADEVAGLTACGFDAGFSSLPWWDRRSAWLAEEHERLARLGAVIAMPEAPFGPRLARRTESIDATAGRLSCALRLAAALGDGLLVPMGFDTGLRAPMDPRRAGGGPASIDIGDAVATANAAVAAPSAGGRSRLRMLTGPAGPVTGLLRQTGGDPARARMILINPGPSAASVSASTILRGAAIDFLPFRDAVGGSLGPADQFRLAPDAVHILEGQRSRSIVIAAGHAARTARRAAAEPRVIIESVAPAVDGGAFAAKRLLGEAVRVEADVFCDGHDLLAVRLLWRSADEADWREVSMAPLGNDRWAADLPLEREGRHYFTIEAWRDRFATFRSELGKKHAAGLDIGLELREGHLLVEGALEGSPEAAALKPILRALGSGKAEAQLAVLLAPETAEAMSAADPRPFRVRHEPPLAIEAERRAAGFASWYELFPRSQSNDAARHGTFDDVIARLPAIREMGFDVVYFPPIHPIGRTHRKGRNNSLTPGPDDPGSPYAIGSEAGGHTAIHPDLGTLDDFRRLVEAASALGLELALDFAIQCSPDHPWLRQHPDWFEWRPDGSVRHAENPPKKYEDIVNVDFYASGAVPKLWVALRDVVLFWIGQGVRLFRVDNPHTKPFPFWAWMIADIRAAYPDAIFLAEAFTRPKVMHRLAKIGFSQSYTYFTWRNTKADLRQYLTDLSTSETREFFRPHFFVNTPDINPAFLQNAPRAAYLIRAALAATLSGLWGMYNGFELCEGRPDATGKEYADSEKYQLRAWDWDRPGNIVAEIARLNRIRRDNPALQTHLGVTFLGASNEQVLFFEKATADRGNVILVAVSLDPHRRQEAEIELPLWKWALPDHGSLAVEDLMQDRRFTWTGKMQHLGIDPAGLPFTILRVTPA